MGFNLHAMPNSLWNKGTYIVVEYSLYNIDIHNHVLVKKINETTRTSTMIFIKYIR